MLKKLKALLIVVPIVGIIVTTINKIRHTRVCPTCHGSRMITRPHSLSLFTRQKCPTCNGWGYVSTKKVK